MLRGLMSRPQDRPLPEPGWPSRQAPRARGRAGRVPPPESAERLLAVTKGRHKVAPWSKLCRGDPAGAHSSHLVPASSVLAQGLPGLCGTRRHSWDEDQSPAPAKLLVSCHSGTSTPSLLEGAVHARGTQRLLSAVPEEPTGNSSSSDGADPPGAAGKIIHSLDSHSLNAFPRAPLCYAPGTVRGRKPGCPTEPSPRP